MTDYTAILKENAEKDYAEFGKKLLPDTNYPILGVRIPTIRKIALSAIKNGDYTPPKTFKYYEECMLCGLFTALNKEDFDVKVKSLDKYLEYVDSWGLTDSVAAAFKSAEKNTLKTENFVYNLLDSAKTYKVRFAIVILTLHFCGEKFKKEYLDAVLKVKYGNYYVDMAIAWYVSVLIVKNRDVGVKLIESFTLPEFIHNKSIQKAVESFRVSDADKTYLKSLKIKK
ncbi:MAG: DNA alkylation repair protein [Clostridia bacterium]|nr:DNA alkylation repair protein [Clostridia bacterium]